jgi:HK97 family phage prohead protease
MMPLHWAHSSDPRDIIGEVDPRDMKETADGLRVTGVVDLDAERGREVWRLMKRNSIAFSFGYLVSHSHKEADGTQILEELDLFEISAVAAPANNRTRLLSTKAQGDHDMDGLRQRMRDEMLTALGVRIDPRIKTADNDLKRLSDDEMREKAERTAGELGPVVVATFEC